MQPQLLTVIDKSKLKEWTPEEWQRYWIEPKYDGYRLTYFQGKFLSRTGKPFHNLEHIAKELEGIDWMLDGELYGENWQAAGEARRSKNGGNTKLKFAVFDGMPGNMWERMICPYSLKFRRAAVNGLVEGLRYVHPVTHLNGEDFSFFEKIHNLNLRAGCDGTVLKLIASTYQFKRTKTWLKVKPEETFDCLVVGMKEGTGKYKGMLGALEVLPEGSYIEGEEAPTTFVSGMTDDLRKHWWKRGVVTHEPLYPIIGKTIEVKARGVHPSGRLIEPRFVRIREDKQL